MVNQYKTHKGYKRRTANQIFSSRAGRQSGNNQCLAGKQPSRVGGNWSLGTSNEIYRKLRVKKGYRHLVDGCVRKKQNETELNWMWIRLKLVTLALSCKQFVIADSLVLLMSRKCLGSSSHVIISRVSATTSIDWYLKYLVFVIIIPCRNIYSSYFIIITMAISEHERYCLKRTFVLFGWSGWLKVSIIYSWSVSSVSVCQLSFVYRQSYNFFLSFVSCWLWLVITRKCISVEMMISTEPLLSITVRPNRCR